MKKIGKFFSELLLSQFDSYDFIIPFLSLLFAKRNARGLGLAVGAVFFAISPLFAEVSISASADKTQVSLNDSIRISVTISGNVGSLPSPNMPDLSAFSVYSSGRSQNVSFINGQVSSSITHSYLLTPKSPGHFTIGSFSVTAEGKTVQTEPFQVEVISAQQLPSQESRQGGGQQQKRHSSQSPGAFVKMFLDQSKVFINEQVILTFRFYYRVNLISNPAYQPPELSGFIYEDLPPPRNFVESVNGTQYHVTEIKTALFPTQSGRMTISPAGLKIRVQDFSSDPFSDDFFESFFGRSGKEYGLKTDPVQLSVTVLPSENKPADFSGGVGDFRMSVNVDKKKLAVGEPLTLTVSVEGVGNIKSLSDPLFPDFPGFRKYDTVSSLNIDKSKGRVEGSKIYKIVLVPQTSGIQNIPPISFSYYHLDSKKYKTVTTSPVSLEILPAKTGTVAFSPASFSSPKIKKLNQDIRYIKLIPLPRKSFKWIHRMRIFPYGLFFPIGVFLSAAVFRWRKIILERNPEKCRFLNAYKKMKKTLKDVPALIQKEKTENVSQKIFDAVQNYFADKMVISPSGISLKLVEEYLNQNQISQDQIEKLKNIWSELEMARYAPAQFRSVDLERICKTAADILERVEREIKKSNGALKMTGWLISLLIFSSLVYSESIENKFQRANKMYQGGQFQDALIIYDEIKNSGMENPVLEYNLGNAKYKLGHSGEAVAHWLRAWRTDPRDSDIRFNLSLVSSQLGDSFFSEIFFIRWTKMIFYGLNLNELTFLFIFVLWGISLYGSWILIKGDSVEVKKIFSIMLLFLTIAFWWGIRWNNEQLNPWGVVTAQKAEVRSGPGMQFWVGFTVPEGRRVLVLEENLNSEWVEIGISKEGLRGWTEKENITKIQFNSYIE